MTDKDAIQKFRPVKVGSCSNLMVGQRVFAIGNPFGLDHTLTQGIVSGMTAGEREGAGGASGQGTEEGNCERGHGAAIRCDSGAEGVLGGA